jgi:putative acetyltransferase
MPQDLRIRPATRHDLPALREVYRDAVVSAPRGPYTEEQLRAWARAAQSQQLRGILLENFTCVAEIEERIVGLCTVEPDGRIALLYVRGAFSRRGIASDLLSATLERAELPPGTILYAEASEFSLPLFRRFGFVLVETERSLWNGVEFFRYKVRKPSSAPRQLSRSRRTRTLFT